MNLLTFLGTADYKPTTYTLDDQQHTTKYCPAATAHFYRPEKTLVVVTEAAEAKHFESLADEISAVTQPVLVPIPDGHSEDELWQIFNALTDRVAEGDELVVDITYGFRSLPFLSFLAIVFLRMARRVKVRRILYGAWDARNDANESPVFDLTPFLTLLDWTIATDRFTRFGDAADFAALLQQEMPPNSQMATDLQARELGKALRSIAKTMESVSLALRLARPLEAMTTSADLQDRLTNISPTIAHNAPPFALLTEQIQQTYHFLSLAEPLERDNWRSNLQIQLDLIGWYLDKGQVVQSLTLAREWLVSLLVYHFNAESMVEYKTIRKPVEDALNNEAERLRGSKRRLGRTEYEAPFRALSNHQEIGKLWGQLGNLRNDIAHVGMKPGLQVAARLRKNAQQLYPRLQVLGEFFGLGNDSSRQKGIQPMILINFSHPLTQNQKDQIERLAEQSITRLIERMPQFDVDQPFSPQIIQLVDGLELTPAEWQTAPILLILPSLNFGAAALLAELHGRCGYFPPVVRTRLVPDSLPPRYEAAEIIGLQTMRDKARNKRIGG